MRCWREIGNVYIRITRGLLVYIRKRDHQSLLTDNDTEIQGRCQLGFVSRVKFRCAFPSARRNPRKKSNENRTEKNILDKFKRLKNTLE